MAKSKGMAKAKGRKTGGKPKNTNPKGFMSKMFGSK